MVKTIIDMPRKTIFILLLLAAAALAIGATSTIGPVTVTQSSINVTTPTTVTFTVPITDASLIPNSVKLLRLGAPGTQPTVLGVMHDDGKNGDAVAGDHIHSLQLSFNEPTAGQIQLQVSAAIKGLLKRSLSPVTTLQVREE